MMEKKILFTDLDDTLLTSDKRIADTERKAIEAAAAAGHAVVLTSGRPLAGMMHLITELDMHQPGCYAISYNGGLIYDIYEKKTIFEQALPMNTLSHIYDEAKKAGLHFQTYDDTNVLCEEDDEEVRYYEERIKITPAFVPDLIHNLKKEPIKALLIELHHPEKLHAYRDSMKEWSEGKVDIFFSNEFYLEHVCPGISKGNAIHFLCDHLGIPIENSIAAGDAENDISMLQEAGIGAAMCNGTDAVKSAADYVTTADNNHGGLAEIINKFMLNIG